MDGVAAPAAVFVVNLTTDTFQGMYPLANWKAATQIHGFSLFQLLISECFSNGSWIFTTEQKSNKESCMHVMGTPAVTKSCVNQQKIEGYNEKCEKEASFFSFSIFFSFLLGLPLSSILCHKVVINCMAIYPPTTNKIKAIKDKWLMRQLRFVDREKMDGFFGIRSSTYI